jgi:hypothetical protein
MNLQEINFVFKSKEHKSTYMYGGHSPNNTFLYKQLKEIGIIVNSYDAGRLPNKSFIYEYEQPFFVETRDFFGNNGFSNLDPIPAEVLLRIKNKTAFLVISMPFESPLQPYRLEKIHEYFKKLDLPYNHVFYLTGCLNAEELYNNYCTKIGEYPSCTMKYNFAENLIINSSLAKEKTHIEYSDTKTKTFLMFNRRWVNHPHRTIFLYHLFKRNIIENFFISFSKLDVDHGKYNYPDSIKNHYSYYFNNDQELDIELVNEIDKKLPLFLDTDDLSTSLMFDHFETTSKYYENSFISIVSETYFHTNTENILHLTEKTFKPILNKHPFIILGPPNMLKYLRKIGFKTFNEFWDESYDETLNHTDRFYKILNLCEDMSNWSITKKLEVFRKCKDIVDYNFQFLLNYNNDKTLIKSFINNFKLL